MRMGKKRAMALLMGAMLLLQPAVSAKAEMQEGQEAAAQIIVHEGEVYELYKVEKLPTVVSYGTENDEGIRTVREATNYYYRSARATNIVRGEITNNTYAADGTKIATLKQTTEWQFYIKLKAPDLLSANTEVVYCHPAALIEFGETKMYTDTSFTRMYVVCYTVVYRTELYDDEQIYTECDKYGNVW